MPTSTRLAWTAWLVLAVSARAPAGLLSVPQAYRPERSWPVVVSLQDNPSPKLMGKTDYFLVHAGGVGMACSRKIRSELLRLARRYNIDPLRIYGTGFSRGGQEILIQAWQHPDWFAAVAPICSDLRPKPNRNDRHLNVKYLFKVPTLMLHGLHESFRPTGRKEYELMKQAGCRVLWKSFPGGHSPAPVYAADVSMILDFFDEHKLDPYPRTVVHLVQHKSHSRAFWVDAILVSDDPRTPDGPKATFKVTVEKGNRIRVQANELISALELDLNATLVDMTRPVTVLWGEKRLYAGPPRSRLTVTLRPGRKYQRIAQKPLWQELAEIRARAATQGETSTQSSRPRPRPSPRAPEDQAPRQRQHKALIHKQS